MRSDQKALADIVSLEGIPEEFTSSFELNNNPGKFNRDEIMKLTKIAGPNLIKYDPNMEKRRRRR